MPTAEEISKLLSALNAGNLDTLKCPNCTKLTVFVSFTHPGADEYRVWFTCSDCSFSMSGRHLGQPPHFSENRIDPKRQADDVELFRKLRKFPRP
jgi:hypothetical protein